jgi:hypothetical protein
MKTLITITLALCLASGASNVYGQQTEKQKTEKAQKEVKMQKAGSEKQMEKEMEKAREGDKEMNREINKEIHMEAAKAGENPDPQGNAYGRNKGGLEGKEFGQARAADAKAARRAKAKRERIHKRAMVKRGR